MPYANLLGCQQLMHNKNLNIRQEMQPDKVPNVIQYFWCWTPLKKKNKHPIAHFHKYNQIPIWQVRDHFLGGKMNYPLATPYGYTDYLTGTQDATSVQTSAFWKSCLLWQAEKLFWLMWNPASVEHIDVTSTTQSMDFPSGSLLLTFRQFVA